MSWLFAATWKGSLLLGVALGIHTLLRDRVPARWRYALLLVVMLRLLVPVAPAAPFSVFNLAPVTEPAAVRVARPSGEPVVAGARMIRPLPLPLRQKRSPIAPIVLALWSVGALLVIARVVHHSTRLGRRLRRDTSARSLSAELLSLLDECREVIGVRRHVRVITSSIVDTPSLHGLFKPTILIPSTIADTFTDGQLRFIFLHELGHLRRRDVVLNWITTVIHALQWFNPLVWIAVARLSEDRELACDALALAALDRRQRGAYGETVLQILDRYRAPSLATGLIGMSATKRQMKRRIQMIATFRNESRRAGWLGAVVAVLALVTLTDARAGDRKMMRALPLTPEAKAVLERLDQNMDLELTAKSIDDVLNAVSNRTGVLVSIAPDAVDAATRQAEITLKAKNLPAHIILMETLASLDLGLEYNADGATVVKMPQRVRVHPAGIPADGVVKEDRVIVIHGDEHAEGAGTRFVIDDDDIEPPVAGHRMFIKKIGVDNVVEEGKDGVMRRNLKLRGDDDQPGGTLELEVKRAN